MDVKKTQTINYYKRVKQSEQCNCDRCLKYYKEIKYLFPQMDEYLSSLGVDTEKPFEAVSFETREVYGYDLYFAWYIVFGECEDDYKISVDGLDIIKATSYPNTGIEENHFVLETSLMEFRKLKSIEEKESYFKKSDGWLLSSISKKSSLENILSQGDFINHAVFNYNEFNNGLIRLRSNGLVNFDKGKFSLTKEGLKLKAKYSSMLKAPIHNMIKLMDELPNNKMEHIPEYNNYNEIISRDNYKALTEKYTNRMMKNLASVNKLKRLNGKLNEESFRMGFAILEYYGFQYNEDMKQYENKYKQAIQIAHYQLDPNLYAPIIYVHNPNDAAKRKRIDIRKEYKLISKNKSKSIPFMIETVVKSQLRETNSIFGLIAIKEGQDV